VQHEHGVLAAFLEDVCSLIQCLSLDSQNQKVAGMRRKTLPDAIDRLIRVVSAPDSQAMTARRKGVLEACDICRMHR